VTLPLRKLLSKGHVLPAYMKTEPPHPPECSEQPGEAVRRCYAIGTQRRPPGRSFWGFLIGVVLAVVLAVAVVSVVVVAACLGVGFMSAVVCGVYAGVIMAIRVAGVAGEVGVVVGVAPGYVVSSARAIEAMGAPAVAVTPVMPRAYAEEDSVIEIAGSVEADRGAGVRRIVEVSIGADRRRAADDDGRSADRDGDLGVALWHDDESG
jgi:hypothetical protein